MINKQFLESALRAPTINALTHHTNEPALKRQLKTAKEILWRLRTKQGQVLADDAGLGKTWTAALVALNVASNGGSVLILVPNKGLQSKWVKDIGKVIEAMPALGEVKIRIQQKHGTDRSWSVQRSSAGSVVVATHAGYGNASFPQLSADLLLVDEAHRSKNDTGEFKKKLVQQANRYQSVLFLTATPFSIRIEELSSMLDFVAGSSNAMRTAALKNFDEFVRIATGDEKNGALDVMAAIRMWRNAVGELKPWVIRHTIDDLPLEATCFGKRTVFEIDVPEASAEVVDILIRVDRLLSIAGQSRGLRGNDPRFHVGWEYLRMLLSSAPDESWKGELKDKNRVLRDIIEQHAPLSELHAKKIVSFLKDCKHDKINAVVDAIAGRVRKHEKVVIFCHHLATAREIHRALKSLPELKDRKLAMRRDSRAFDAWQTAWENILKDVSNEQGLREAALTFVTDAAFRTQVRQWLRDDVDKASAQELEKAFRKTAVRLLSSRDERNPKIAAAVIDLAQLELHDDGAKRVSPVLSKQLWHPTMISESDDLEADLALFNSPFGPDVLVATDKLSEGVDLHRCCRILVHYELDPSPIRVRQREGRVRRIGGWAATVGKPVEYAYPAYKRTRDEALVRIIRQRLDNFDLLLGGAPKVGNVDQIPPTAPHRAVLKALQGRLGKTEINGCLCSF
jgi:hypothetical protein